MTFQEKKEMYHRMPAKYRKHGNIPGLRDMESDVEDYQMHHIAKHTRKENTYDDSCLFCNKR